MSFLEALREKYASNDPLNVGERAIEISGKVVEEVGFEKIRRLQAVLQDLKIVLVDGQCLAGLGSTPWTGEDEPHDWKDNILEVEETCPNVRELNMSRSLLESFKDIIGICRALPKLRMVTIKYVSIDWWIPMTYFYIVAIDYETSRLQGWGLISLEMRLRALSSSISMRTSLPGTRYG